MNKPVFYGSLYFKFTNFVWFTCTNPLQDIWAKGTVHCTKPADWLIAGIMKHTSLYIFKFETISLLAIHGTTVGAY